MVRRAGASALVGHRHSGDLRRRLSRAGGWHRAEEPAASVLEWPGCRTERDLTGGEWPVVEDEKDGGEGD